MERGAVAGEEEDEGLLAAGCGGMEEVVVGVVTVINRLGG